MTIRMFGSAVEITDVTPRKRAEAELQLAQRALACSSDSVIVAAAEPPDGRIVYVNPAFTRITGYQAEEALGQGWSFLGEGAGAQPELGEVCGEMQRDESVSVLVRSRSRYSSPSRASTTCMRRWIRRNMVLRLYWLKSWPTRLRTSSQTDRRKSVTSGN